MKEEEKIWQVLKQYGEKDNVNIDLGMSKTKIMKELSEKNKKS